MMEEKGHGSKEIFSRMVKAGKRTYFIAVKETAKNQKFVTLTESKLVGENKFDRFNIMVFQDKLGDFAGAFAEACKAAA